MDTVFPHLLLTCYWKSNKKALLIQSRESFVNFPPLWRAVCCLCVEEARLASCGVAMQGGREASASSTPPLLPRDNLLLGEKLGARRCCCHHNAPDKSIPYIALCPPAQHWSPSPYPGPHMTRWTLSFQPRALSKMPASISRVMPFC